MKKFILLLGLLGFVLVAQAQLVKTLTLNAGELATLLTSDEKNTVTDLTLSGTIDARDFKCMRDEMPLLGDLNISGVNIVAYEGEDGTAGPLYGNFYYPANEVPFIAFFEKSTLKNVVLSETINTIGHQAFNYCNNLETINLPQSLQSIGHHAFAYCSSIASVIIPDGLWGIDSGAFSRTNCSFQVSLQNNNFASQDGILFNKDLTVLIRFPGNVTGAYTIPESVLRLEIDAFAGCSSITSLTLPSNLNTIEQGAISNCAGLSDIEIPSSVNSIGNQAFYHCQNLININVLGGVPLDLSNSSGVFEGINLSVCTLNVPYGTKAAYQAANQWQDFENIVEATSGFYVEKKQFEVNHLQNSVFVYIDANVAWTASCPDSWVTFYPVSPSGDGTSEISIDANTDENERTAQIEIAADGYPSQYINVTQQGKVLQLIISEARYDAADQAYIELTNMDNLAIDLSSIEVGNITPWTDPYNAAEDHKMRLPAVVLQPGESYLIASVYDYVEENYQRDPNNYINYRRKTKEEFWTLADLKIHFPESANNDPTDEVTPNHNIFDSWDGRSCLYLRHHINDTVSKVIDQVGGVFDSPEGRNNAIPYDVAGYTGATKWTTLVRKYSVKTGNLDFAYGRGSTPENSEWIVLPHLYTNFEPERALFWTAGNHGNYELNEQSISSSVLQIDWNTNTITAPWGIRNNDDFAKAIDKAPGIAWHYELADSDFDKAFASARTGDRFTLYACGNERQSRSFDIVLAQPVASDNIVLPKFRSNKNGSFPDFINSGLGEVFEVTRYETGLDSITKGSIGIPFATRVDTLFKYLEKPANASWEMIWKNGTPRSDLMDGDLLRVTAENGAVKEYYIKVNNYQANDNAELACISWPDIPQGLYNQNGWDKDVIPGFVNTKFSYLLTVPSEVNVVPALVAKTSNLNASLVINRAKNLHGTEADRTTTFTVTAENGSETRVYKVIFVKEKAPENLQPNTSEPFFSQIVCREDWANSFIEIYNPGNQPLDLSRYMVVRTVFADPFNAVLESALPSTFDYRYKRYVPGYIWTENQEEWDTNPGILYPDQLVNPLVQPGDVFVLAKCNQNMANGQPHPRYNEVDVNFLAGHTPWGYNMPDDQYVAYGWTNETYYLYKILNDSVLNGTKALINPADVALIDVFGRANGENWGMIDGQSTDQNSGFKRLAEIQNGNTIPGASFGTGAPGTSEWKYTNSSYWQNEGYSWPLNNVMNSDGIGYHNMDASTIYSSTVSAAIYQVSDGYSMNENIRIVKTGTTVNAFLDQIIKHHPAQQLSVLSAADGSVLGGEALLQNNDALLVVSADGKNTTKYFIELDDTGLSSNSILTSTMYNIVFGDTSVHITGFDYETTIRNVLNNVNVPAGATLTVLNGNNEPVPLQIRNENETTTDLNVSHDIYFEVVAEDRINTIVYQLLPQSNEDVFVTSAIYGVDQSGALIKFIEKGVAVEAFLSNLLPSQGADMQVNDKDGYPRTLGVLATDDRLLVTAADGVTTKTYRLYFVGDDVPALAPGGFDEYSVGDYLAVVDDAWTTWNGIHGGSYDGLITSDRAYSQPNSVKVEGTTGLLFPMGNRTSGRYELAFKVYVPEGNTGYFHVEHDDAPGGELGLECFFNINDAYLLLAGEQTPFSYFHNVWFDVRLEFDIDNDYATIFINDQVIRSWQWSKQVNGNAGMNQLGCLNMYANNANGVPLMFFDNLIFKTLNSIPCQGVGLVGLFNGWGASEDVPLTATGSNPYELSVSYQFNENTEVKFRLNNDWSVNWGGHQFPEGFSFQDGPNIQVPAGNYLISFNAESGYYSFEEKEVLSLRHSYTFEDGTAADVIGGAHGSLAGGTIDNGIYTANNQGSDYIELPAADIAINNYQSITLEAYVETGEMRNDGYTMMAYFGDTLNQMAYNGIFQSIARGDDNGRTAISCLNDNDPFASESGVFGPELESAALHHVVTTIDATSIKFYIDGQMHGEANLSQENQISNLSNHFAWLCKGGYASDPTWLGKIYEYNIYSGVMLQGEISQKAQNFLSSNLFASFESSVRETTPGNTINFTDQSSGNPTAWVWDFGDGGSSTEQHPSHMYQSEGIYTVTLTVNNGTVSHATVKEQLITVNSPISIELLTISSPVRMPNATHHCAANYEYPIEIKLVNKGQTAVSDLVVVYLIDDVEMGRETITTSINVGDTLAHQFSGNVNFYTNNYYRRYKIECRVEIADIDEADNGKLMYFNVFGDYHDAENWTTYNSCDGMVSDISFALAEDKNGNIWSTCFYGASRYNGTSWEKLTTNEGLNENYSWAILNDSQGNIWLAGAENNTITRFDGSNFTYYPQPHIFEECIHEDARGRLWFGAYQAQGIAMFNGSTWTYFLSTEVDFGSNIQSIGSDINGNIFVSCYDSETGTPFVKMYNGTSWSDFVIPGNGYIISEIFLDTSGKTWFTASNGTFYNYDGSNWQVLTSEDIGVNMYCNDISEDPWGNVWFGGNHDVVAFNGSGFEHHFAAADGLAAATSHEVYAVYADSEGYLWIGTYAGGISVYNLNALHPSQQHFNTVWSGNGTDHMNFNVVTAKIDGVDLVAGDEIGLFDGNRCVGAGVLTSTASSSNIFSMVASADDGSGNGYTDGSDIVYKLYKRSVDKEFTNITVNYRTDMPGWVTDGKYEINGTAVIEIEATSTITQNIPLNSGWNIISSMVNPEQADIKVLLQTLIDQGKLRKVMDESGNSLEDLGSFLGGWKNNIGDLLQTEGYKVNVTENCAISLEGVPVSIPLSIPLNAGWNIISFPASGNQDGKAVVQTLIDAGKLKKAMNETGLSIEDLGSFLGGWKNNIGDFVPGKGYKINVSSACELLLTNDLSKSAVVVPELLASDYFKPAFIGNGTDHMNINLVHLAESGIMEGDEIGIFDGSLCVGSAKVGAAQIKEDYMSIPASMNDGLAQKPNGYFQGNVIHLSIFRNGKEAEISFELLRGTSLFAKGESMIARVDLSNIYNELHTDDHSISVSCYPNPFDQQVSILLNTKENEFIKVEVLDIVGRKRNELFSGKVSGLHTIEWNGTDENGNRLQDGTYFIRVNEKVIKVISMNR